MSIYKFYLESVKDNIPLKKDSSSFKSDPRYQYVLEHVTADQGKEYLSLIQEEFKDIYDNNKDLLIDLCKKNDKIGKPIKGYFFDFCSCSPTNLRYIYQSLLILQYMKEKTPTSTDVPIVEIGGGYGGLSFFLHNLCGFFDVKIQSYIMYDLPEVRVLQRGYLKMHNINVQENVQIRKNSFLISNYAFSELPEDMRKDYEKNVINPFCDYGFLAWNCCPLYQFVENKTITHTKERPVTAANNLYVYFS